MIKFLSLFQCQKPVIGMIHLQALPGTPGNLFEPALIIDKALQEAETYASEGLEGVIIENMHDRPYLKSQAGHEISSLMAIIGYEIKQRTKLICGIQILAGANCEAMAAAHSAGLDFIRSEGFVYGHLADEGIFESSAAVLLRFRKQIGADRVIILTDIMKKHSSHALTADLNMQDHAEAAEFFLSDGLIITGKSTAHEPSLDELKSVRKSTRLPVFVGSGISKMNLPKYFPYADGFIVGSYFKKQGIWYNNPDRKRIREFMDTYKNLYNT